MSSADVNNHVQTKGENSTIIHVVFKYNDYESLEFTEVISVMVWIWTVVLLTQVIVVTLLEQWKPSSTVKSILSTGNVCGFWFTNIDNFHISLTGHCLLCRIHDSHCQCSLEF